MITLDIQALKAQLLRELQEDDRELWSIIWLVRYTLNGGDYPLPQDDRADPLEVRRITMNLVRELLNSPNVRAGYYSPDWSGIQPWDLDTNAIVDRINREWDALGRGPEMGEVVVIFSTEPKRMKKGRKGEGKKRGKKRGRSSFRTWTMGHEGEDKGSGVVSGL